MDRPCKARVEITSDHLQAAEQHPAAQDQVKRQQHMHKAAFAKGRAILPLCRQHIDDPHAADGTDIKKSYQQQAAGEKADGKQQRIRKQHPGKLVILPIIRKEHGSNKLRPGHSEDNANDDRHSAHTERFRKKQPADRPLLHPHHCLDGKFFLPLQKHIVIDIPD